MSAGNRRLILYDCGLWFAVAFLPFAAGAREQPASTSVVRVTVVVTTDTASARMRSLRRGIEMGAEEARHTLQLFGDSLDIRYVLAPGSSAGEGSLRVLQGPNAPAALVRAVTGPDCLTITTPALVPAVDVGCDPPEPTAGAVGGVGQTGVGSALRRSSVLLHVRPPASSSARALDRSAGSLDGDRRTTGAHVEMWHASLDRFGAEQLNQRFERRFGAAMDSDAWAGWIAMKILAESALRARGTTGSALGRALIDPKARFDGHKGRSLAFDATTGVLRQPLYIVAPDSTGAEHVVAEVSPDVQ